MIQRTAGHQPPGSSLFYRKACERCSLAPRPKLTEPKHWPKLQQFLVCWSPKWICTGHACTVSYHPIHTKINSCFKNVEFRTQWFPALMKVNVERPPAWAPAPTIRSPVKVTEVSFSQAESPRQAMLRTERKLLSWQLDSLQHTSPPQEGSGWSLKKLSLQLPEPVQQIADAFCTLNILQALAPRSCAGTRLPIPCMVTVPVYVQIHWAHFGGCV